MACEEDEGDQQFWTGLWKKRVSRVSTSLAEALVLCADAKAPGARKIFETRVGRQVEVSVYVELRRMTTKLGGRRGSFSGMQDGNQESNDRKPADWLRRRDSG